MDEEIDRVLSFPGNVSKVIHSMRVDDIEGIGRSTMSGNTFHLVQHADVMDMSQEPDQWVRLCSLESAEREVAQNCEGEPETLQVANLQT